MSRIYVLGDTYHCRRAQHSGERRGILLPEVAREQYCDALVLAAGPGIGVPMQARVGDRILCAPSDFEGYGPDEGFVSDRRLVGVIRGPDHVQVEPANAQVLIKPDPREWEKTLPSGIIVTQGSLVGSAERLKERAFELVGEYQALVQSPAYLEEPNDYYRARRIEDFAAKMSGEEHEAFGELLQQLGSGEASRNAEDYRPDAPLRLPNRMCSGVVWGVGPDVRDEVELGSRVAFSFFHRVTRLTQAGELLFLVDAEYLDCQVPHGVDFESKMAA